VGTSNPAHATKQSNEVLRSRAFATVWTILEDSEQCGHEALSEVNVAQRFQARRAGADDVLTRFRLARASCNVEVISMS
jgi:hypothetical protein